MFRLTVKSQWYHDFFEVSKYIVFVKIVAVNVIFLTKKYDAYKFEVKCPDDLLKNVNRNRTRLCILNYKTRSLSLTGTLIYVT